MLSRSTVDTNLNELEASSPDDINVGITVNGTNRVDVHKIYRLYDKGVRFGFHYDRNG